MDRAFTDFTCGMRSACLSINIDGSLAPRMRASCAPGEPHPQVPLARILRRRNSFLNQRLSQIGLGRTPRLMSKALLLFIASFWLLVLFASGARANIVCAERAGAAWYGGATASAACAGPAWPARDGAMVSHVLKGEMRHAFSGATACSVCEGPVSRSRWSNGSRCAVGGAGECVEWTSNGFF